MKVRVAKNFLQSLIIGAVIATGSVCTVQAQMEAVHTGTTPTPMPTATARPPGIKPGPVKPGPGKPGPIKPGPQDPGVPIVDCSTGPCRIRGGGGSGPIPFGANKVVELADGEKYVLMGSIEIAASLTEPKKQQAWLRIDLEQHPWLGTRVRKAAPYYPISGTIDDSTVDWVTLSKSDAGVVVYATARARVLLSADAKTAQAYIELNVSKAKAAEVKD